MDKKTKRAIFIGIGTLGALGLAWLLMKGRKGNPQELPTPPTPTDESCIIWPLKRGSGYVKTCEKPAVKVVQMWLNNQDWVYQTWVDGMFGPDTEELLYYSTAQRQVDQAWYNEMKTELGITT